MEQTSPLGERVSRIEGGYERLATKADVGRVESDLAQMKSALRADVARVGTVLAQMKAVLKADIARIEAELKSDIARQDGQIRGIKWWILSVGAAIIALSSIIELLPLSG